MQVYLDCIPCLMAQALRAGRVITDDPRVLKRLLDAVGLMIQEITPDMTPPESAEWVYAKIREITGVEDPYRVLKQQGTQQVLALYPALKQVVASSADRLRTAVQMAVAGNVMDFGVNQSFDIESEIASVMKKPFGIWDFAAFRAALAEAPEVLYLGDNAGESVLDRILIEELPKPVTYVVRSRPVINDVTYDDAVQAGLDRVATVVASGTAAPGTCLKRCAPSFREQFARSRLIISKGQGNYEALSQEKAPVFFMLKAKCRVIAEDIGVREGDLVLKSLRHAV